MGGRWSWLVPAVAGKTLFVATPRAWWAPRGIARARSRSGDPMDGGDCASCCGACTVTTDLDNSATPGSCVCYEASTAPSGKFYGTSNNDCVFIEADNVQAGIYVQNQCLEGAGEVLPPPRRGS